jgi:hypothetical protein
MTRRRGRSSGAQEIRLRATTPALDATAVDYEEFMNSKK